MSLHCIHTSISGHGLEFSLRNQPSAPIMRRLVSLIAKLRVVILPESRHHLPLTCLVTKSDMASQVGQVRCLSVVTTFATRIWVFLFIVQLALLLELSSKLCPGILLGDTLGKVEFDDGRFLLLNFIIVLCHGHCVKVNARTRWERFLFSLLMRLWGQNSCRCGRQDRWPMVQSTSKLFSPFFYSLLGLDNWFALFAVEHLNRFRCYRFWNWWTDPVQVK